MSIELLYTPPAIFQMHPYQKMCVVPLTSKLHFKVLDMLLEAFAHQTFPN